MATKQTTKAAPRGPKRVGTKPAPKNPKKAPVDDGLSRTEIEKANAAGPGAVANLIRGGGKAATPKTPVKGRAKVAPTPKAPAPKDVTPRARDPRLPRPGTVLTRTFNGKEIKVEVLDAGFRYDGKTWRSLSAIAKTVSGTSWNGFLFFNLQERAAKPVPAKAARAATAEAK